VAIASQLEQIMGLSIGLTIDFNKSNNKV